MKFNAAHADDDGRITALAKDCGFENAYEMADEITAMKKRMKMRCTLSEIGCTADEHVNADDKKPDYFNRKRHQRNVYSFEIAFIPLD